MSAASGHGVLVTGMGGELGTRVAQLIEERELGGRHHRCRLRPAAAPVAPGAVPSYRSSRSRPLAAFIEEFAPHAIAHFGVYEPTSRMTPASANERTELCTNATMQAAARTGALEYVVVRSGLEVYGPPTHDASVPDENIVPAPRTPYGLSLLAVEGTVKGVAVDKGIPVGMLRYAPVVGSHVPSPLGRLLRLPVVPVSALSDPPFSLLHPDDAAHAMVAAMDHRIDGPCNIVGPGAASPWQAARLGGRVPLPVPPGAWPGIARDDRVRGAAIAPHVVELIRKGCTGDGNRVRSRSFA